MDLTRHPLRRGTARPVLLEYTDASGERSMRQVLPLAVLTDPIRRGDSNTYLQAKCSIAKAIRTFRFDRIDSISDPASGETQPAHAWIADLSLSDGKPFSWGDEQEDIPEVLPPEAQKLAPARNMSVRAVALALFIGYSIGRFRIIPAVLHHFHQHYWLWL